MTFAVMAKGVNGMSCKECIHFGICKRGFPWADGKGGGWCEDFKNKALLIKVPCNVGDKVYVIRDGTYQEVVVLSIYLTDKQFTKRRSHVGALFDFGLRGNLYLDEYGDKWVSAKAEAEKKSKEAKENASGS